jgi:AmmeMemoRadiSam system protein A
MLSSESPWRRTDRDALLRVARDSIAHGLREGRALPVDPADYAAELRQPRASFVTLRLDGKLRGCTGSLEACEPLVVDVSQQAYRTAFADPRFLPVAQPELGRLEIHISILGPLEPLSVESERALLAALRPGLDGLILREGSRSATFLPAVWQTLPSPAEFVRELRCKAGLAPDHWSDALRFQRYRVDELG